MTRLLISLFITLAVLIAMSFFFNNYGKSLVTSANRTVDQLREAGHR